MSEEQAMIRAAQSASFRFWESQAWAGYLCARHLGAPREVREGLALTADFLRGRAEAVEKERTSDEDQATV